MIQIGKSQVLVIVRIKEFGVYLGAAGEPEQAVLLPKKQVPDGAKAGDELKVFIYRDSEDRLIATTAKPRLEVGETGLLQVKEVGKIGAFLDIGLEKDLLLPFKEQTRRVQKNEECLVSVYVDKSGRLAATMNVYSYMRADSPYQKDDKVTGIIYDINDNLGAFVAVDNCYYGLIPKNELYGGKQVGDRIEARVTKVREDGKLDLSLRDKAYVQMDADARILWDMLQASGGILPFNDKADPDVIKREADMSKNAFKRAVGRLLKEGKIRITETGLEAVE